MIFRIQFNGIIILFLVLYQTHPEPRYNFHNMKLPYYIYSKINLYLIYAYNEIIKFHTFFMPILTEQTISKNYFR